MGVALACRDLYRKGRDWVGGFLANDDPLAAIANSGAFLVWSNQPFYPIYVWALVGRQAWPALLTWLSTPFFVGVALLGRTHPLASRGLFVVAGVVNTLISVKAFGSNTAVGWFLVPCLVIAATFFRAQRVEGRGPRSSLERDSRRCSCVTSARRSTPMTRPMPARSPTSICGARRCCRPTCFSSRCALGAPPAEASHEPDSRSLSAGPRCRRAP